MKKLVNSFVFIFLFTVLSNATAYAENSLKNSSSIPINLFAPPTVSSPLYYCQNSPSLPLRATASAGGTLNWYGTNATGGTASGTAPTPTTTIVGTTSYYVSETVGGIESTRSRIDVIVVADNGSKILLFRCDPSQIVAPATIYDTVHFDWTNNASLPNQYTYSYSVDGASAITGTTVFSSLQVSGLSPGQSVTLTVSHTTYPCDRSVFTCSVPCGASTITPNFSTIPTSYCLNEVTTNLPTTATNSITGSWDLFAINTTITGTTDYIFTPDPVLFPCALKKTLSVTVGPVEPNFSDFSICSGEPAPNLNTTSPNGIAGTWSPSTIDNTISRSYDFTPNPGQTCAPTNKTIFVTVNQSNAIVNLDWTVTAAFAKNQIVTVTDPVGVNYLYQLDDGPFQESPVFEYVSLGTHSITVKDVNGCSEFRNNNVLVVNYPKFFTPNNDGYNDSWNILALQDQSSSKILIFDRYGKFLKEIFPNGSGWDGTYIGQPMPANDYWFSIEYIEQGIPKKFKSHFSLKR